MILVINIILLIAIVFFLYRKASESQVKNHFFIALSIKLVSGILLGILYFHYYGSGDTLLYHKAASWLYQSEGGSFQALISFLIQPDESVLELFPILREPRSAFFIKIITAFYILTSGSYWLTSIYFSLFSFIGSWYLTDSFIRFNPVAKKAAVVSFLYFPSFVFWTSGILKESIAWGCLAVIMGFIIVFFQNNKLNFKQIFLGIILLYVLWSIKYHYVAVLGLCFFPPILSKTLMPYTRGWGKMYPVILGILFVLIIIMFSHPNFRPARIISVIQENHEMMKEISGDGKSIRFIETDNLYIKFFVNIPLSLFAGLFMPLPWQGVNILAISTGILNLVILVLFAGKLTTLSVKKYNQLPSLIISLVFYVIILAILMAYTTPNFGTLERYKTSYIGFFLFWIFYENLLINRIFKHNKQ